MTGQLACYRMYRCGDDRFISVGGLEAKFFGTMVTLMGRPELANLQFDVGRQPELHSELEQLFASEPSKHWLALLALADTCVGPVNTLTEAMADPLFVRNGALTTARFRDDTRAPVFRAVPWEHSGDSDLSAPLLGEDTDAFLVDP